MNNLTIIAEAGVNHNGSLKLALKLIDIAARAKADYVKFQTYITEDLVQKEFSCAGYQKKNSSFENQFKMLKKYELNIKDFKKIIKRCNEKKIGFLSSPFDLKSISLLKKLKVKLIKIPSGEITNIPYLKKIGKLNRKIILSTGMANTREIKNALKVLTNSGSKRRNISLLHCNTEYPVKFDNTNLKSIIYLKKKFKLDIGFSDHTVGFEAALISVGLGAKIIEKHFTIDKSMKGPDHKAILNGNELVKFVSILKDAKKSLGKAVKTPSKKELQNARYIRKNIVAKENILKGQKFSENNLTTKRSKPGISSENWNKILNKIAKFNFKKDQNIKI